MATSTSSLNRARIGLLTLDSVNEMAAGAIAARSRNLVVAAPTLDSLRRAGVDAIAYDLDHLQAHGDPVALVTRGAARVQVAFGSNIRRETGRELRGRGVIVCRRLGTAIRLLARLVRPVAPGVA